MGAWLKREFQGELQVDVIIKDNDGGNGYIVIDLSAHGIDAFVEQPMIITRWNEY